jgi:hypothetical protein
MRSIIKDRGNNALTSGGRHFIFIHNNQPIVRGSNGRDVGEDVRPGQRARGGVVSLFRAAN